jgi:two-component system OmpR family response regulator
MMNPFPSSICIVDDDEDFAAFLAEYLSLKECRCDIFVSAEELLQKRDFGRYDFFILDLGLPGIDGVDLTTLIRANSSAGILIISGRLGPDAFNSALAAGADMFMNKPVRFDQVLHATQSIWRRYGDPRARSASWMISHDLTRLVSPTGEVVSLSPYEGRLLDHLRQAGGESVSRADLAAALSGTGGEDHRNLDATFFRLRRKIERDAKQQSPFRTVHGVGYQLAEDIEPETV